MSTNCTAITLRGRPCRNKVCHGEFCRVHDKMINNTKVNFCNYVDEDKNRCLKKCDKGSSCFLHSEDNQCAICYEPMLTARMFVNCKHTLCTGCFSESVINKPNCPMCRAPVEKHEILNSIKYLIQSSKYVVVIYQTFYSASLSEEERILIKNHFITDFETGKFYNSADMLRIVYHLKSKPEIYSIFLKMLKNSIEAFVKNTEKTFDSANKYQYKFII